MLATLRCYRLLRLCFFFTATATTAIYTLSLHDALPICAGGRHPGLHPCHRRPRQRHGARPLRRGVQGDRKSTRLNSSHANISYAVFCLKKKKKPAQETLWLYADIPQALKGANLFT